MHDTRRKEPTTGVLYRFGLFALDVSALALTKNGIRVRLQDQPLQLLVLLLERSGEIVTREELRQRLWPSNTFVDFDKSLGVAVLKVRDALGDSATNPTFLETLPRRGYRFIAPVTAELKSQGSPDGLVEEKSKPSGQPDPTLAVPVPTPVSVLTPAPVPETAPISGSFDSDTVLQGAKMRRRKLWTRVALLCVTAGLGFAAFHLRPALKDRKRVAFGKTVGRC